MDGEAQSKAVAKDWRAAELSPADQALCRYAEKLTVGPGKMTEEDVAGMRSAGWDDGEILEINQIICYFNYVNRLLNGLGVTTDGDVVGYYKSD